MEGQEETDGGVDQPEGGGGAGGTKKTGTRARKGPGPSKARETLSNKPQDFQVGDCSIKSSSSIKIIIITRRPKVFIFLKKQLKFYLLCDNFYYLH